MGFDDDDGDEDSENSELPDESDMHDPSDESADTIPCPWCRAEIYEHAEVCPCCGKYRSGEDTHARIPLWFLIGVVLCLIAIALIWLR